MIFKHQTLNGMYDRILSNEFKIAAYNIRRRRWLYKTGLHETFHIAWFVEYGDFKESE